MIRIHKPGEAPAVLRDQGAALTAELCRLVDDGRGAALSFERSVYGAPEVKAALREAQHDKCCFCESKITHVAYGDVEHFRPKAAVRPSSEEPAQRPGYYWLAYAWPNLYLACEQCNRRHKSSLFPLEDERGRVRSHREAERVRGERPLFVDPGDEEPDAHIRFRRASAGAVPGSRRGQATIDALGLNRAPLRERRQSRRESLLALLECIRLWVATGSPEGLRTAAERAAVLVLGSLRDDSEYAAMARALLRDSMPWYAEPPLSEPRAFLDRVVREAEHGRWLAIPPR